MKIECIKEKIVSAIVTADKATGKNPTLPILSSIYLEASQNSLLIRATNLDVGIELIVPVKVVEKGNVVVQGAVLANLLINLKDEKVVLETVESGFAVTTKSTGAIIKTFPADDFPTIPKIEEGKKAIIESNAFLSGLEAVSYAAAVTSVKPELSSVYIHADGEELVFVATDSFRLGEKRVLAKKTRDFEGVLIPLKNISEITRFLGAGRQDIEVVFGAGQISFSKDGAYLVSRVIDGIFPDYKQIIPKEFKTEATLLKQDFVEALKLAHVFSDAFNQVTLRLVPGEKLFEIKTKNNKLGENPSTLDAVLKGEDLELSFNYKYLVDCFQSIESDSLSLAFQGPGKPMLIKGVSDKTFLAIVMPMNK